MNEVCSWCGKAPHAGGCVTKSTMPPPPSAEELQRRMDYLQSDDFRERVKAALAGRSPASVSNHKDWCAMLRIPECDCGCSGKDG